jgi:hypothetical protein
VARKTKVGERRRRTLASHYRTFADEFGNKFLHEVAAIELKDFVDGQSWEAKTHNEFLQDVALLYRDAEFRGLGPKAATRPRPLNGGRFAGPQWACLSRGKRVKSSTRLTTRCCRSWRSGYF